MPASDELVVSRFERRKRGVVGALKFMASSCIVLVALLSVPGACGGIIYWIVRDTTVADNPVERFDTNPNCEVVEVVHKLINSSAACYDHYTYRFQLPTSPVVYFQRERTRRADDDCSLSDLFSGANGTFKVGPVRCFSIKEGFKGFAYTFNCAQVFRRNNGTVGDEDCSSIFVPTSDYDASSTIGARVVMMIYCCCHLLGKDDEE